MLERERELADRQQQLRDLNHALTERDQRSAAWAAELDHLRATVAAQGQEIDGLRNTLQSAQLEIEQARAASTVNDQELDELRAGKLHLETALADAATRVESTMRDMDAAREQIAGLETELKEERSTPRASASSRTSAAST